MKRILFKIKSLFQVKPFIFLRKNWLEIVFVLLIVAFILVETLWWHRDHCCCVKFPFKTLDENKYYLNNIIVILLLFVNNIIAISYSVSNQSIYKATVSQYRNLGEEENNYPLTKIVMISIVLFAISIVFYYTDLLISDLVLNVVALFYCFYFCVTEIPILAKNRKTLCALTHDCIKRNAINQRISNFYYKGDVPSGNKKPETEKQKEKRAKVSIENTTRINESLRVVNEIVSAMINEMGFVETYTRLKIKGHDEAMEMVNYYSFELPIQLMGQDYNQSRLVDWTLTNLHELILIDNSITKINYNHYITKALDRDAITEAIYSIFHSFVEAELFEEHKNDFEDVLDKIIKGVKDPYTCESREYDEYFVDISNRLLVKTLNFAKPEYYQFIIKKYNKCTNDLAYRIGNEYDTNYFIFSIFVLLTFLRQPDVPYDFRQYMQTIIDDEIDEIMTRLCSDLKDSLSCASLLQSLVYFYRCSKDYNWNSDYPDDAYAQLTGNTRNKTEIMSIHIIISEWIELVTIIFMNSELPSNFVKEVCEKIDDDELRALLIAYFKDSYKLYNSHDDYRLSRLNFDFDATNKIFDSLAKQSKEYEKECIKSTKDKESQIYTDLDSAISTFASSMFTSTDNIHSSHLGYKSFDYINEIMLATDLRDLETKFKDNSSSDILLNILCDYVKRHSKIAKRIDEYNYDSLEQIKIFNPTRIYLNNPQYLQERKLFNDIGKAWYIKCVHSSKDGYGIFLKNEDSNKITLNLMCSPKPLTRSITNKEAKELAQRQKNNTGTYTYDDTIYTSQDELIKKLKSDYISVKFKIYYKFINDIKSDLLVFKRRS